MYGLHEPQVSPGRIWQSLKVIADISNCQHHNESQQQTVTGITTGMIRKPSFLIISSISDRRHHGSL